ncbi:interferon-induced protein 44-like isoform X2 [Saccostrea cucullata]|uniref:interferon-induced protein 44-like isoform X2 n=1 Tax=Saccostrea cuccullata TaxID=36930 RepID=UPI002ED29924
MNGLLKHKDKNQLSEWIGRKCQFELLYKISRDGGTPQKFHELCDNKGPTVTMFYNVDKYVYGGYLSEMWESVGNWAIDQNAFLFKLYSAGKWNAKKFPYLSGSGDNYFRHSTYGPLFGSLWSIEKSELLRNSSGYFPLSTTNLFSGKGFNLAGDTAKSVSNGHNNVTDLEVYLLRDGPIEEEADTPWRDAPEWDLQEKITTYEPFEESDVPEANVLLIGQVGSGKSSILNTINSIFKGTISSRACTGSAETSLTKSFEKFQIRDPATKRFLKLRICDTRGVEEGLSIKNEDLAFILDGNLPNHYTFNPAEKASSKVHGFIKYPTLKERMHVVVFVIDGSTLDVLSEGITKKLKDIKANVVERDIPQLVFLTKMDKICPLVENDVSNMFLSEVVEDAVNKAADVIAIPRSHVLPVKNYEKETKLQTNINILALGALHQALMFADDFLENQFYLEGENATAKD